MSNLENEMTAAQAQALKEISEEQAREEMIRPLQYRMNGKTMLVCPVCSQFVEQCACICAKYRAELERM
jgi:RecG-like helicase